MQPEKTYLVEIATQEDAARKQGCSQLVVEHPEDPHLLEQAGYYPQESGWVKNFSADDQLLKFKPAGWRADIEATLVFLRQGKNIIENRADDVLLIRKKTGHGKGKINAPGGKLEKGESVEECARREMFEEVGLAPCVLTKMASLRFVDAVKQDWLGHIFVADDARGEMRETREAAPFWCSVNEIPYAQMWRDDQLWLPEVMRGKVVSGTFYFVSDSLVAHRFVSRTPTLTTGEISHHEDRYFSR